MFTSGKPGNLITVGLIAAVCGVVLIKRGVEGDTLIPGTQFSYFPRWLFVGTGLLLLLPLPAAIWFLWKMNQA